jgi:alpha-L-fucosidase
MFIHWGAYSVAARGEWVMNRERIPLAEYRDKYVRNFTAERYDPATWVELAKAAGMKYIVLTTRHHDGFALWDTKTSDFNAARLGPKRDLLRPFVEAVRAGGLKVCLYYSGADWNHPDYGEAYARDWPERWHNESARKRFVAYNLAQVEELLTNYGHIDVLWYDGCIPQPLDGEALNRRAYELQPHILLNERMGEPCDFRCSEQSLREHAGPWESCMTLNRNWGYHAGDEDWKPSREVIHMLVTAASRGGNLCLNVGPRADGTIPEPSERILREAGDWLRRNNEFLPNSDRSPFLWNNSSLVSTKGNRIYLHLFHSPGAEFCWAEPANRVLRASLLDGGAELPFTQTGPRVIIRNLPVPLPDPIATTIVLEVEGAPAPATKAGPFWIFA